MKQLRLWNFQRTGTTCIREWGNCGCRHCLQRAAFKLAARFLHHKEKRTP